MSKHSKHLKPVGIRKFHACKDMRKLKPTFVTVILQPKGAHLNWLGDLRHIVAEQK
jgi:hypothetical protein